LTWFGGQGTHFPELKYVSIMHVKQAVESAEQLTQLLGQSKQEVEDLPAGLTWFERQGMHVPFFR
jgi:hypothetical protein